MEKMKKMIYISFIDVVLFVITFLLYFNDMINYTIVVGTITLLLFIYLCYIVFSKNDEKTLYNKKLKNILKTYDSILVYSDKELELENENIMTVKSIENLVTAQEELKKPILYIAEEQAGHFVLRDEKEILIYTIKINEQTESCLENKINEYIEIKNKKSKRKKRILNDLEKTTIIRLDDDKFYKVSPVKKDKK